MFSWDFHRESSVHERLELPSANSRCHTSRKIPSGIYRQTTNPLDPSYQPPIFPGRRHGALLLDCFDVLVEGWRCRFVDVFVSLLFVFLLNVFKQILVPIQAWWSIKQRHDFLDSWTWTIFLHHFLIFNRHE